MTAQVRIMLTPRTSQVGGFLFLTAALGASGCCGPLSFWNDPSCGVEVGDAGRADLRSGTGDMGGWPCDPNDCTRACWNFSQITSLSSLSGWTATMGGGPAQLADCLTLDSSSLRTAGFKSNGGTYVVTVAPPDWGQLNPDRVRLQVEFMTQVTGAATDYYLRQGTNSTLFKARTAQKNTIELNVQPNLGVNPIQLYLQPDSSMGELAGAWTIYRIQFVPYCGESVCPYPLAQCQRDM